MAESAQPDIYKGDKAITWATPPAFLEYLAVEKGWEPDLDPACEVETAKAPNFFTVEDNGIMQSWFGNVWLNPPYGRAIPTWLEKCALEIQREEVRSIYVLIPARTDTRWFHDWIMPHAYNVYLIKGRFNFEHESTVENSNAPFPSMLILYRKGNNGRSGITTLELPKEARGFGTDD